ncbi:MAG: hypothetical protein NW224_16740 [Leptolyngbyaceae cyanobacterium bins.302]|nr:hypothetical protein [Leptolyngbyaceae cyanobacterium bins.302]
MNPFCNDCIRTGSMRSEDCGIYWRETDPPERGAEAPDWFYVPNVPPLLGSQIQRSYVLWREYITPVIALEFASGDVSEERDRYVIAPMQVELGIWRGVYQNHPEQSWLRWWDLADNLLLTG